MIFVGRLATYRYYNMDQVVGQALAIHRRLVARAGAAEVGRLWIARGSASSSRPTAAIPPGSATTC